MVIGRGDIASVLKDRDDYVFHAAGFSNRDVFCSAEKEREIRSIETFTSFHKMFVYFGSLSIYYANNEYVSHKLMMESLVRNKINYCILRIGNITFGDNPYTLINSLKYKIQNNLPFEIQDTYRYLIDKDELLHWIDMIPKTGKHEMNITGRRLKVAEIVKEIESGRL